MKTAIITFLALLSFYTYWCYKDISFSHTDYIISTSDSEAIMDLNHHFQYDENTKIHVLTIRETEKLKSGKVVRAILIKGTGKKWSTTWKGLYDPYGIPHFQKRLDQLLKPLQLTTRKYGNT